MASPSTKKPRSTPEAEAKPVVSYVTAEQKAALFAKYGKIEPPPAQPPPPRAREPQAISTEEGKTVYLSAEQKAALDAKYGKIKAPDPEEMDEVLRTASGCNMQ